MDISSVSAPPAVPSRANASSPGLAQPVPGPAPANTGVPGFTPSVGGAPTAGTPDTTSPDSLAQAVKQVNESFTQRGQNLYASFEKDKATGIDVVKIVDKKTNETISQMPPKEMVALAQFLENPKGMRGQLINAKA